MERQFVWEPLGPDQIARITWTAGAIITEDLARATMVELSALTRGKRVPMLADIRPVKSMTRGARVFFGNATDAFLAIALLAGSPATRVMANVAMGLSRPKVPTQMFTDEEKALTWLRRYAV